VSTRILWNLSRTQTEPLAYLEACKTVQHALEARRANILSQQGIEYLMEYICLTCFHRWDERLDKAKERQCSNCKSRAVVEYQQFETVVSEMRQIIRGSERPIISISKAVQAMSPLASQIRPGPLRIMRLWRKVLLEAGVRENELDNYLRGQAT
jgi:DNA-directed RNA polymerase subunit RPC12/RpoP